MTIEWLNVTGSLIGAAAAIIASLFAGVTLNRSRKEQKNGLDRQRKQATLDAFNVLQRDVLDELTLKRDEVAAIARNYRTEEYKKLTTQLARIEHFCVGVNDEIYDLNTLDRLAGPHIVRLYDNLYPLIEKKRSYDPEEHYYDDFECVAEEMRRRHPPKVRKTSETGK